MKRLIAANTVCLLSLAGPLAAAPPSTGRMPDDQLVDAHQDIQQAQTTTDYTFYLTRPSETDFVVNTYRVAYDRSTQRLRVERPGFTVVCDGTHLTLTSPSIKGRFLRAPLTGRLTLDKLTQIVPDLADPLALELVLLLEDPPAPLLSAGGARNLALLRPDPRDPDRRPRLTTATPLGNLTLYANPGNWQLDEAVILADAGELVGSGLTEARYHYDITWDTINQPLDESLFTLDTQGQQSVASMQDLLAAPAGGSGGGGGGPTLIGQALPDIDLQQLGAEEPVNLKELAEQTAEDGGLLIVEFYANWCRPSVLDVPALVRFSDWCEEHDKPVTVVLIAVMQPADQTRDWLTRLQDTAKFELDLPVLLDSEGKATQELLLPTIPRTLVVKDGQIVDVLGGLKPAFGEDLQQRAEQFSPAAQQ